ncbi:hypothetical protein [Selenomonas ruminantium]|uniref:Uncharacterized protein n=1 Tax=Selenomonas ruminantium TaxID=971 RepID=A0A1I0VJ51_SELRU|nr:hypothetical protein [Selenomonas ruminantium]SFA76351.1 hypothetical protein SAMN05216587_101665 [Selenomonas ruminantium]
MRTKKNGVHMPRDLKEGIQRYHDIHCTMIEGDRKKPSINLPKNKIKTRWSPGFCKICGEHMECVTNYHAGLHGYKSADAMIKDNMIEFD